MTGRPPAKREIGTSLSIRKNAHNLPPAGTRRSPPRLGTTRIIISSHTFAIGGPSVSSCQLERPKSRSCGTLPTRSSLPPLSTILPIEDRHSVFTSAQGPAYVAFILSRIWRTIAAYSVSRRWRSKRPCSKSIRPIPNRQRATSFRPIGPLGASWAPAPSSCCTRFRSHSAWAAAADRIERAVLPLVPTLGACHAG